MEKNQLLFILLLLSLLSLSTSTNHHHHHHHHTTAAKKFNRKFDIFRIPHPYLNNHHLPKPVVPIHKPVIVAPTPTPAFDPAAKNICTKTANPDFCLCALGPLASSVPKPSLKQMSEFMAEAAIKQTKVAAEEPVRKGNEVCRKSYGSAVEGLEGIVEAMKAKSWKNADVCYDKLVGNYDACMKEMEKIEGGIEYKKDDLTLKQMSEYLLAMVKEVYT